MTETISTTTITHKTQKNPDINYPWYSKQTGIYSSKHPKIHLPENPFLDIVTHIFSYPKSNGNSVLIDSFTGHSIPFYHLLPSVKSMAIGLQQLGFSQGDVGLILLPNSIYLPIVFMGVLYLGGVITPMNPLSSFTEVKKQTVNSQAKWVFCNGENVKKLLTLGVNVIEVPENVDSESLSEFIKQIFGKKNPELESELTVRPVIKQDDTATIMYSSGTSGASKGVMLSHRNLIAMVELFVRFEASQYKDLVSDENVYLAIVPMFHVYGLAFFGFGLVSLGTNVVIMRRFDIEEVIRVIQKFQVTHFPVVPPVLAALTAKGKSLNLNSGVFNSLKQVSCGAAPTAVKVITDFLDTFPTVDFIQGYGMTESTAVGTRGFNIKGHAPKFTSVGLLAPNTEAKIVNLDTGLCMPPGKSGELLLRSPGNMKGYLDSKEATRQTIIEDGWLHTADVAYFDNDGYLYIIDRLKDIIKYKGFQIAPADLESILMDHPEITDVAVIGAADEEAGEIPVAFVVKRPGSLLSRDEVINYVASMVAPYKKVREVVFMNSIPKSVAGKVLRRHLKNFKPSKL